MLRKISLVLSVLAALGFAVSISTPADAFQANKGSKGAKMMQSKGVKSTKTMKTGKTVIKTKKTMKVMKTNKFIVGKTYNTHHVYFGHKRHRWHNKWYGYGEGECWIRVDGEWFWNLLVCPN